ncbi:MAG: hypothetical protein M1423_06865 [Acidobacteria bacterium]|nr:hypothetical protein [Acidobacteriota bacterium]
MGFFRVSVPDAIKIIDHTQPIPPVFAEPSQLHQVLVNLLANATHAIGPQPGRLEIILSQGSLAATANTV